MPIEVPHSGVACCQGKPVSGHAFSGKLPTEVFATVVAHAPLVSIDLIVHDRQGKVLLGRRRNPPAKDYWFVPGGRVRKNETLDAAFCRLTEEELGITARRADATLLGVYEHFYDSDFSGLPGRATHYVVLAYRLHFNGPAPQLPIDQHSEYQWVDQNRVAHLPSVHPYTLAYFATV